MTVKWQGPRRLVQPVTKVVVIKRENETAQRINAGTSHRMADRRRGWHRGARR